MKRFIILLLTLAFSYSGFAFSEPLNNPPGPASDTLLISSGDTTEYEILIIETGYENWMLTNAKPKWFYTNDYYRNKNQFYVIYWNNRVIETMHKPPFEEMIDYNPTIDFGLDVNYKLYWYFKFIEYKYKVDLYNSGRD